MYIIYDVPSITISSPLIVAFFTNPIWLSLRIYSYPSDEVIGLAKLRFVIKLVLAVVSDGWFGTPTVTCFHSKEILESKPVTVSWSIA